MLILATYDVNTQDAKGARRLYKVARLCTRYGQRVQNSVFECQLDNSQLVKFRHELENLMDKEKDSLRLYNLGNKFSHKVIHLGKEQGIGWNTSLIF